MSDAGCPSNPSEADAPLRVGYILAYRAPNYIRTESLLAALRSSPAIAVHIARNKHQGIRRYIETWKALRKMVREQDPQVYVLGFRGHEIFWLIRWMTRGKPLILDALVSPYGALGEHAQSPLRRRLARLIYPLERRILRKADLVLTDTHLHVRFYAQAFSLPSEHFHAVPVGAIEQETSASTSSSNKGDPFSVLFYGSFLPLHGVNVILAAAAQLGDLPIYFDFVGGSATEARRLHRSCEALAVTKFTYRRWVAFEQLLREDIPQADLCLGGPFGGTPQARRVVTGKASQCLALGKATVIGRIDEDYGFIDRFNCLLVPQDDVDALAASIRWAYENREALRSIGARGREAYSEHLSIQVISARLQPALRRLSAKSGDIRGRTFPA